MEMLRYVKACFLLLLSFPKYANGNLIIAPEDREVMVGESTYFNCSTSTHEMNVHWYFYAVGATGLGRKHVYAFGKLYSPYDSKVRVENISLGAWNLVILSASLEDAGRYACEDQGGIFEQKTAELVVLATDPACDSNIELKSVVGPNSCGIEPDMLTLTCSVTYNGSISPMMQWKSSRNNESLSQNVTSKVVGNMTTYNLTMKANRHMNGNFFFCETTKSTSSQYNCTSAVINVLYLFRENSAVNRSVHIGDEIMCSANKSKDLVCDYKWKWFYDGDINTESQNSNLKPKRSGLHICEATCNTTKGLCNNIQVMRVNVSSREKSNNMTDEPNNKEIKDSSTPSPAAIAVPIAFLLLLIIVAVLIGIWVRYRKNEGFRSTVRQILCQKKVKKRHSTGGKEKLILEANRKVLVDLIDPSELLVRLDSEDFIKKNQRRKIASRTKKLEKAQMILEILLQMIIQGRHEDYQKTIKCLRDTGHSNVANVLERGEVVIRVHSQMCDYESFENASGIEDIMVTGLTRYMQNQMSELEVEGILSILEKSKVKIIAARTGGSVVLYVSLAMMEDLRNLEAELESGDLKNVFEMLYAKLIPSPVKITLTVKSHDGDLDDAKVFFQNNAYMKTKDLVIRNGDEANPTETTVLMVGLSTDVEKGQPIEISELDHPTGRESNNASEPNYLTSQQIHEVFLILQCYELKDFDSYKKRSEAFEKSNQSHEVREFLLLVREPSVESDFASDNPGANRIISFDKAQCLIKGYTELLARIHFDDELLSHLGAHTTFTPTTLSDLRDITDTTRRGKMILGKLANGSQKQFSDFCEALKATKQKRIAFELLMSPAVYMKDHDPIRENDSDNAEDKNCPNPQLVMATEDQWEKVIRSNFNCLIEKIDAGDDLLGALKKADIFTNTQLKRFWSQETSSKKITLMLQCLERKDYDSFKKFCAALEKSNQGPVVREYLCVVKEPAVVKEPSTKPDPPTDDPDSYKPIPYAKARCLTRNYTELLNAIDFNDELLGHLEARNTFTTIALNNLMETTDTTLRGQTILSKLENGSEKQFNDFCEALNATKLQHVVSKYLTPLAIRLKSQPQPPEELVLPTQITEEKSESIQETTTENISVNVESADHGVSEGPTSQFSADHGVSEGRTSQFSADPDTSEGSTSEKPALEIGSTESSPVCPL